MGKCIAINNFAKIDMRSISKGCFKLALQCKNCVKAIKNHQRKTASIPSHHHWQKNCKIQFMRISTEMIKEHHQLPWLKDYHNDPITTEEILVFINN